MPALRAVGGGECLEAKEFVSPGRVLVLGDPDDDLLGQCLGAGELAPSWRGLL